MSNRPNEEPKKPSNREILKYEIAEELGLTDKINSGGWKSLTARESGRIGGILAKREKLIREALAAELIKGRDTE